MDMHDLLPPDGTGVPRILLTVNEAARALALSRSSVYRLVRAGKIRTVHVTRKACVPVTELDRFVTEQFEAQRGDMA
jgi:DNA binding domain, excisionase family